MTQGVLIFAFDNEVVEYTRFAAWSARRIQKYLSMPVTLVTNTQQVDAGVFDHVIQAEAHANGTRTGAWLNLGRYRAAELSPYDQTVLLDADYVVNSDQLAVLFDCEQDIMSMREAYDVTGRHDYQDLNFFGRHRMPSAWATVIYWRRSHAADLIFGMMEMIENNWQHYKDLYGIAERRFRNDYALAIASNTVMGHLGHWPSIPWSMANLDPDCEISQLDHQSFEISYQDQQGRRRRSSITGQDFHVMNKTQLEALIAS